MTKKYKPATLSAQALGGIEEVTGSVIPAIYPSTTYVRDPDGTYTKTGLVYSRPHNPTYKPVEALLTALEIGADSMLFASGTAAAITVFQAIEPDGHIIAPKIMYWAIRKWLQTFAKDCGLSVEFVDCTNLDEIKMALKPGVTKLIWLETPSNPMWGISDIKEICQIAHDAGAIVGVDSTVASPALSQPITLGADIVMHSATKYLNGHSDVIAGCLTCARQDEFWEKLALIRSQMGAVLSPHDAAQLLRGMRTLHLRVKAASENALFLAEELQKHPKILEVLYPGLPTHPGHDIAKVQMSGGFGGMFSIRLKDGEDAAMKLANSLKLWKHATSLGGVESLVEHRASIEGPGTPVPWDLLRMSTGIEDNQDLLDDIITALDMV